MRFRRKYSGIELDLTIGNTRTVSDAVVEGHAELGFVEGELDSPALSSTVVAQDALVVLVAPDHPWADGRPLSVEDLRSGSSWVMREDGSGTRSEFERAIEKRGLSRNDLQIALTLPSNEAVLSANALQ